MGVLDTFRLDDKVALVTGAGQGLGQGMALALAEAGADIVIAELNPDAGEVTARMVQERGRRSLVVKVNVSRSEDVATMTKTVIETWKRIDILVNNAGITFVRPALEIPETEWNKVLDVDLNAIFHCCKAVAPHMINQRGGKIINISSMAGFYMNRDANYAHYHAAKGGVIALTKALALEWAKHNIYVNVISPGFFLTPMNAVRANLPEIKAIRVDQGVIKRYGQPYEDLGGAVVFLASATSNFVTGHNLVVDGGYTL
jgi:NAD(P)-dependent dehydrogenase (short-subunit alcohol dehydrogenase family)